MSQAPMNIPLWLVRDKPPGGITAGIRNQLGPLAEIVDDPRVTDVFLTGSGVVFVDTGEGSYPVSGVGIANAPATDLARGLIEAGGRHVDEANPLVDVHLGGGLRVHVALSPISTRGPEISIRIQRHQKPQLDQLSLEFPDVVIPRLIHAVETKQTLLISGATGSGKTTLLGALMAYAASTERLVVLEDLAELMIDHPHVVSLECRQANMEGKGEVTLTRLVREALRMKPSRLIVGECRGGEIGDLVQAFHTGHRGGATTVHAHSVGEVPLRLDSLAALAGIDSKHFARHAVGAFDLIVHLERVGSQSRRISFGHLRRTTEGELDVVVEEIPAKPAST
jgi:pilus assembly protein CpaF